MKVYLAICHSNAYYDDYVEERVIGAYKDRDSAVHSIFRDMMFHNSDNASYKDITERCKNFLNANEEGLYEIIEKELE